EPPAMVAVAVATVAIPARVAPARGDALFQFDDLEAAFPLLLARLRFLLRLVVAWFHGEPPFVRSAVQRTGPPPARRASVGAMRGLLGGETAPAALLLVASHPVATCPGRTRRSVPDRNPASDAPRGASKARRTRRVRRASNVCCGCGRSRGYCK